ncbi:MAG TPA: hypothetical protein VEI02_05375, partial [Planctomycetota bacterium]|nr:hypothetical protein [Planctomycetota bacterium]
YADRLVVRVVGVEREPVAAASVVVVVEDAPWETTRTDVFGDAVFELVPRGRAVVVAAADCFAPSEASVDVLGGGNVAFLDLVLETAPQALLRLPGPTPWRGVARLLGSGPSFGPPPDAWDPAAGPAASWFGLPDARGELFVPGPARSAPISIEFGGGAAAEGTLIPGELHLVAPPK